jgi:hypothetical protein
MFSSGVGMTQAFLKQAVEDAEAMRARAQQAADRGHRRMHTADTEDLQAQVDQLRLYVATLFQILIAHGVFTAAEVQQLMARLDASDGAADGGYQGRDVVTGAELPPEVNPFTGLGRPGD